MVQTDAKPCLNQSDCDFRFGKVSISQLDNTAFAHLRPPRTRHGSKTISAGSEKSVHYARAITTLCVLYSL